MSGSVFSPYSTPPVLSAAHLTSLFSLQGILAQPQPWWKIQLFMWEPVLFGTWDGVFTSCMINIFGVVLFLRTGWLVVSDELVALEPFWWAWDMQEHLGSHSLGIRVLNHRFSWKEKREAQCTAGSVFSI